MCPSFNWIQFSLAKFSCQATGLFRSGLGMAALSPSPRARFGKATAHAAERGLLVFPYYQVQYQVQDKMDKAG